MSNTWLVDYYLAQFGDIKPLMKGKFYLKRALLLYLEQEKWDDRGIIQTIAERYKIKEKTVISAIRVYLQTGWPQQKWAWIHLVGWTGDGLPRLPRGIEQICAAYQPFLQRYAQDILSDPMLPYYLKEIMNSQEGCQ